MDNNLESQKRRTFLTALLGLVGSAIAVISTYPIIKYILPLPISNKQTSIIILRSVIDAKGFHLFNFQGRPAIVLQDSDGEFSALSVVCTHLGCIVKWLPNKKEYLCPCHAGRYTASGIVLSGPPPKPLKKLPVRIINDQVQVG